MMTYVFDRYIDGHKMAEGVRVNNQPDLQSAMPVAARLAAKGSQGQVPVLILVSRDASPTSTQT